MKQIIKIRGHHIEGILEYFRLKKMKSKKDPFRKLRDEGYGAGYIENKRRICDLLYLNPNQQIKIVNTLDDLCKSGCKKRNKNCTNLLFTDAWSTGELGFMCGETYSSQQFISYVNRQDSKSA